MKLQDNFKNLKPIPFEACGNTWYMKPLTVNEVKSLQSHFAAVDPESEDLSAMMYLFTDVLVDAEGEQFEDIKDGMTIEELENLIPIQAIVEISEAITEKLNPRGN